MLNFAIRTVVNAVALWLIAKHSHGMIAISSDETALLAAFVLGVLNAFVRPILFTLAKWVTCVLSCITMGIWTLVLSWLINAWIFYMVGTNIHGFKVDGFSSALWAALALSVVNAVLTVVLPEKKDNK